MLKTYKSLSIWLLVSLLAGAGLGAWAAVRWKDGEIDKRVAAAVQVEKDRQQPLREEVDALRLALERQRLVTEAAAIAGEVDARNFGLARQRLVQMGENLTRLADSAPAADAEVLREIAVRQEEILANLEALDPRAAEKMRQIFADLNAALAGE